MAPRGSAPPAPPPPELSIALDRRLRQPVLARLLGQVTRLGIRHVCLVAEHHSAFRTPCCVSIQLSPALAADRRALRVQGSGVLLERKGHPAERLTDGPEGHRRARSRGVRVVRLGAHAQWVKVVRWLAALASLKGARPELVLDLPAPSPGAPRAGP